MHPHPTPHHHTHKNKRIRPFGIYNSQKGKKKHAFGHSRFTTAKMPSSFDKSFVTGARSQFSCHKKTWRSNYEEFMPQMWSYREWHADDSSVSLYYWEKCEYFELHWSQQTVGHCCDCFLCGTNLCFRLPHFFVLSNYWLGMWACTARSKSRWTFHPRDYIKMHLVSSSKQKENSFSCIPRLDLIGALLSCS